VNNMIYDDSLTGDKKIVQPEDIVQPEKKPLQYYDKKTKTTLKGFSQIDLERLYMEVRWVKFIIGILGTCALLYVIWLTWYVIHFSVLNNVVSVLGKC
jgi:hypothetical protein